MCVCMCVEEIGSFKKVKIERKLKYSQVNWASIRDIEHASIPSKRMDSRTVSANCYYSH